ncbi:MAG: FeoA family protein [Thermodesulfobacteriota bacterium]
MISGDEARGCTADCAEAGRRLSLNEAQPGDCVCVRAHKGCKRLRKRLLDMGLTPQARVDVVNKAPLGGPLMLKVGDFDLLLSKSEADQVEVEYAS